MTIHKIGTRVKILRGEYGGQLGKVTNHTDIPQAARPDEPPREFRCWHLVTFDEPMLKPVPGKEHEFNAGSGIHGWVLPEDLEVLG